VEVHGQRIGRDAAPKAGLEEAGHVARRGNTDRAAELDEALAHAGRLLHRYRALPRVVEAHGHAPPHVQFPAPRAGADRLEHRELLFEP
jgi:hypothetical protein